MGDPRAMFRPILAKDKGLSPASAYPGKTRYTTYQKLLGFSLDISNDPFPSLLGTQRPPYSVYKYSRFCCSQPSTQPRDHPTQQSPQKKPFSTETKQKVSHIFTMQLITFLGLSLATLGAHAAGGISARLVREQVLELNPRASGVRRHSTQPSDQNAQANTGKDLRRRLSLPCQRHHEAMPDRGRMFLKTL